MMVAGVDEAGRGSIIGPLVIAGVTFTENNIDRLSELGVKDSKMLSKFKREELDVEIRSLASNVKFFELQPRSIDAVVKRSVALRRLNYLEAVAMACVLRDLSPDEAFVDASDVDEERYGRIILKLLPVKPRLVCEHKADVNFPVVSAASILAKVRRDSKIAELRELYGDFGSGYPSDEDTIEWLEAYFREHRDCPPFIRSSWEPVRRIRSHLNQTKLATTNA